jgi:AbrB family looped-hinge helix DNA binding protein
VRITSKGQVTIPQAIRDSLGLLPHSEVEFEIDGDSVRLRKARQTRTRGAALVAHLRDAAATRRTRRLTTDQILALTRG